VVGPHADLGDGRRVEHGATRHGHAAGERGRGAHDLVRGVHTPRAAGLVGAADPLPSLVVERRLQYRAEEQVTGRPQLVEAEGARLMAQVGLPTS
jgi:hypothetical protein